MLKLKTGDIVTTKVHGDQLICFTGRNGCNPKMCFGEIVRNGKRLRQTNRIFMENEVTGFLCSQGIQLVFPLGD